MRSTQRSTAPPARTSPRTSKPSRAVPLDEAYFVWLYSQVASVENKNLSTSYWTLLRLLHSKEFVWDRKKIDKDGNRAQDGKDLRSQFLHQTGATISKSDEDWLQYGCSVLELMVALAWHLEFNGGETQSKWFWVLVDNLGLSGCTDADPPDPSRIELVLDTVLDRQYAPSGAGGFFPLQNPEHDQRDVELWYQLNEYLLERL